MSGLKESFPELQFGKKATPDELDQYQQYQVIFPSISPSAIGTVTSATANPAFVLDNIKLDYPRNVLFSILGVAGGMGGTAYVVGKNQFGDVINETFAVGSANGGGSVAGTKVFAQVTAATLTGIDGLGGTAIGTARLGYAIGTATNLAYKLGLPTKVAAASDVKAITWQSQFVGTAINGGTIGTAQIDTTFHAFKGQTIMAGTESFTFLIKSTFDNAGKADLTRL